jgi:hypothetical protein
MCRYLYLSEQGKMLTLILPVPVKPNKNKSNCFFCLFGRLECVCHSFGYVAQFVFLREVWFQTQRAVEASRRATNLATHLPQIEL